MNLSVSTELCAVLIGYAKSMGIKTEEILNKVQLNTEILENTFERIPIDKFILVWDEIIEKSDDQNIGLKFGSGYALRTGNILKTIMLNCKNLGEAIEKFINYHIINAEITQFDLIEDEEYASLVIKPISTDIKFTRQSNESFIATIAKTFIGLSDEKLKIEEIYFTHEEPDNISFHNRIFNTKLTFGSSENRIVFNKRALKIPIAFSDRKLLHNLQEYADKLVRDIKSDKQWSLKVKELLSQILVKGNKPGIDQIASNLNLSTRNLQAKLKLESTTYQTLLDKVRKDLSLKFIENPEISITDMAFLMAYSDQSSFCNSFKKWTGNTPLEYRKSISKKKHD